MLHFIVRVAFLSFALFSAAPAFSQCSDIDFNNDGVFPSDLDLRTFQDVVAGSDCLACDSVDFNGDGVFPDEQDYNDFISVLSGGACSNGGFTPLVCSDCPQRTVGVEASNVSDILTELPKVTVSGKTGTPAIIRIPWRAQGWEFGLNWPGQDGLAYGGLPGRPLIFLGIPGPQGQRPEIRLPSSISAGVRMTSDVSNTQVRGLRLVGTTHQAIVAVQGSASDILVEDNELIAGAGGVMVQGIDRRVGKVRIRRNIIKDQRHPVSHSQGIYVSADTDTLIEQNALINTGTRNQFCHGMYLVHTAGAVRNVINNWVISPGSACIQARGGKFNVLGNLCAQMNTGIGTGHPMAFNPTNPTQTVWTDAYVAGNYLVDARSDAPAQWGFSYMLGRPTVFTQNVIRGVARPWMSSVDQGGGAQIVPIGSITKTENILIGTRSQIDWNIVSQMLQARPSGQWSEAYETSSVESQIKRSDWLGFLSIRNREP